MAGGARQRMIESTAVLMRERGVEATSFADVLALSGAPRGSIYHHFPEGKAQLVEEATRYAGDIIAAGLASALSDDDPVRAVRAFSATWQGILGDSDFAAGCPVVAATLEGDRSPGARASAGAAFSRWEDLLAEAIAAHGPGPQQSRALATLIIASIEGAIVLSRAQRSSEPLARVTSELERLIADAIA